MKGEKSRYGIVSRRDLLRLSAAGTVGGIAGCTSAVASETEVATVSANRTVKYQGPAEDGPYQELSSYSLRKRTLPVGSQTAYDIVDETGQTVDDVDYFATLFALQENTQVHLDGSTRADIREYVDDARQFLQHSNSAGQFDGAFTAYFRSKYEDSNQADTYDRFSGQVENAAGTELTGILEHIRLYQNALGQDGIEDSVSELDSYGQFQDAVGQYQRHLRRLFRVAKVFPDGTASEPGVGTILTTIDSMTDTLNWAYIEKYYFPIVSADDSNNPDGGLLAHLEQYENAWRTVADKINEVRHATNALSNEIYDSSLTDAAASELKEAGIGVAGVCKAGTNFTDTYANAIEDVIDDVELFRSATLSDRRTYRENRELIGSVLHKAG